MANPETNAWAPTGLPPLGQYRVTLVITGDDPGPDVLAWLVRKNVALHGHIVHVESIEQIGKDLDR